MTATATADLIARDHELVSSGLIESASVKSITDFIPSKLDEIKFTSGDQKDDFSNTFICHLIFYAVFCVTLVLYILIDLGLGSFLKNKFVQLIGHGNKTFFDKMPAFA